MINLEQIATEQRNPTTADIDALSTLEIVKLINKEDYNVPDAISKIVEPLAKTIDETASRLSKGGRLFYIGCGTSGRLGVVDAAECPPTYNTSPDLVQGIIAGGEKAMFCAIEGAEDNSEKGIDAIKERGFTQKDVLVGIAASGRTPFVLGAITYAKKIGGLTIGITCSPNSPIGKTSDIDLTVLPGPEVITGSTRMKAGSATKMILNIISTGTMIRLGKVYGNLMVDLQASNEKLKQRCVYIVSEATGVDRKKAEDTLHQCDYHCKTAIIMILCNIDLDHASCLLEKCNGNISEVLKMYFT